MGPFKVVVVLVAALLVSSCGRAPWDPDPQPTIDQFVAGLARGDLAGVPGGETATADLTEILSGMDGLRPTVTPQGTTIDGRRATTSLAVTWPLPAGEWRYETSAQATLAGGEWRIDWAPSAVHPELTSDTRLLHRLSFPARARIVNAGGAKLAGPVAVQRLGLNKPLLPREQWESSARRIAQVLGIDEKGYLDRVTTAGDQAFVEALAIRGSRAEDLPAGFESIPGAAALPDERTLPVQRGFA